MFSVSAVIDETARQSILNHIETGKTEGRVLVTRDVSEIAAEGYYVSPTIFADVPGDANIAREEILGPVLAIIKAKNMDEALVIANSTDYALTGGIFSRSPKNIDRCINEFIVGNLYINRTITGALVGRHPFGGLKMSGAGAKAGGPDYLQQFMNQRTVTENTLRSGFAPKEEADWLKIDNWKMQIAN